MNLEIFYGVPGNWFNVTQEAYRTCFSNGTLNIPDTESSRITLFAGDPLVGVVKSILIKTSDGAEKIYPVNIADKLENVSLILSDKELKEANAKILLDKFHSKMSLKYGFFHEEYPEQMMAAMFIRPTDVVLEIGGNIGRNSCIIAKILEPNSSNLLVVECDPVSAKRLNENRILNNFSFHIESSAISNVPLKQKAWDTCEMQEGDILPSDWKIVEVISWPKLKEKYNLPFNVFVLDCEGAFYYILRDNPNILDGVRVIIIENDFPQIAHKDYVLNHIKGSGFRLIYERPLPDYRLDFFQTWQRD